MPRHKEILSDFDIKNPPFVESVIRTSDIVVIYYHLVPYALVLLIAIDATAMWRLHHNPVRQMLCFLMMSALPFLTFVYGVFGVCLAFQTMAIQIALERAV